MPYAPQLTRIDKNIEHTGTIHACAKRIHVTQPTRMDAHIEPMGTIRSNFKNSSPLIPLRQKLRANIYDFLYYYNN